MYLNKAWQSESALRGEQFFSAFVRKVCFVGSISKLFGCLIYLLFMCVLPTTSLNDAWITNAIVMLISEKP